MGEVNTVNGILVAIQCNISPDSTPKTGAVNGKYIFLLTVNLCHEYMQTVIFFGFFLVSGSKCTGILSQLTVNVHQHIALYIFIIFSFGILYVLDVECSKNLLLRVKFHVLVLRLAQGRTYECQQECNDNNHYRSINDSITITIGIHFFSGIY